MWRNVPIKFLFTMGMVNLSLYECEDVVFVCMLVDVCIYVGFSFG